MLGNMARVTFVRSFVCLFVCCLRPHQQYSMIDYLVGSRQDVRCRLHELIDYLVGSRQDVRCRLHELGGKWFDHVSK